MKIVLLGAGGQLAHDLREALADHELLPWTRTDLDITDAAAVTARLAAARPEVVVNTAAYNLVDQAETDPAAAFATNALGPANLARACSRFGAVLMHFSTDYVFGLDPGSGRPWRETDPPGPVSMYGLSKLAGEQAVQAYCPQHFLLRTCGLYGEKGSRGKGGNFVETMLRLASRGGPLRIVHDQRCTPSFTRDVAAAAARLLRTSAYGVYHITNTGDCTWYEFTREIFRQRELSVECVPITSAEFGAAARRPVYSVLATAKLASVGVPEPPTWTDALARYLARRPAP